MRRLPRYARALPCLRMVPWRRRGLSFLVTALLLLRRSAQPCASAFNRPRHAIRTGLNQWTFRGGFVGDDSFHRREHTRRRANHQQVIALRSRNRLLDGKLCIPASSGASAIPLIVEKSFLTWIWFGANRSKSRERNRSESDVATWTGVCLLFQT
jgi:hypothetical protein